MYSYLSEEYLCESERPEFELNTPIPLSVSIAATLHTYPHIYFTNDKMPNNPHENGLTVSKHYVNDKNSRQFSKLNTGGILTEKCQNLQK